MGKAVRGRAGREGKRDEIFEQYSAAVAQLLQAQIRLNGSERILHLGSPGATQIGEQLATRLTTGELVICVYTFDELEESRAALAGIGSVHVINDLEDLDEDEPPFQIVSCIAPYHLGRDTVVEQIELGVDHLATDGTFYLAGDKQREFDRYVEALSSLAREVQQIASRGQYRVVSLNGGNVRKSGQISGRKN